MMKKTTAITNLFSILALLLLFHILIITQVIPYDHVWAGKLKSVEQMRRYMSFSIIFNTLIISTLFIKKRLMKSGKNKKCVNFLMWLFASFFALNTLGNLFAEDLFEQVFGTLLTLCCSVLFLIVARKSRFEERVLTEV